MLSYSQPPWNIKSKKINNNLIKIWK
jgi:hypothetical protein